MPTTTVLDRLTAEIASLPRFMPVGRVAEVGRTTLAVAGLEECSVGDRVQLARADGSSLAGEIARVTDGGVAVLPEGPTDGVRLGAPVAARGPAVIAPDASWIGRVIDPDGRPLDGRPLLRGLQARPLRAAPPGAGARRPLGDRLVTGLAAFDTLLPLVRGQRVGLFAGSGVGKSSLLAMLAQGVNADVIVLALIGERGREVRDFVERVLGPRGMARTVVVAATSDQAPLLRRRCAWTAMAVAEHFRDEGCQVLLLADSVTRFAEAHREIALAEGEPAGLRGFPPSTVQAVTHLSERAGPGAGQAGDITAVFTVLVAGSDMEEPVADLMRGTLDGHVVLSRRIAERGRFPAIDLLRSVSRSLPEAASEEENALIALARRRIAAYEDAETMVQAGLYTTGSDPEIDAAIEAWPKLERFLARRGRGNGFAELAEALMDTSGAADRAASSVAGVAGPGE